ncbi:Rap1a/Tai family immunity protein [Desulfomicrobium baculatum]|uniref:Rap1a immunity protein domain-containing protein n=1 Tax=Desulfomicrobium baculatum (strain DSM 4028 / VKM B-1378 / X) TaxID=525897 RepID=C7LQW6_DESBD|nr:Rap1a/Tai family immunity protein [Desulfomicrobium baculatum]ACU89195.1 conserved hypothetical protein [Desulfomicrobium baculatum DSM 4028]
MRKKIVLLMLAGLLALPVLAGAGVTEKQFELTNTQDLIDLCTATADDPLYNHAVNFCHGYLVGAFQYYAAAAAGPNGVKLVCYPDKHPTRNQVIDMFVQWAKAHPEYMQERAVETEFRFLMETWPCNK